MKNWSKCLKCPAYHLLDDNRKHRIEIWEGRKEKYVRRIKKLRLILVGESMPANRYFYDINSDYENGGMRINLQKEFDQMEISESQFLESFTRKGIILHDCALCPLYLLKGHSLAMFRKIATYCFLTHNMDMVTANENVPIATIFPSNRGWLKTEIPWDIRSRINAEFSFSNLTGLKDLYLKIKKEEQ